jgi:hypothetical protein
MGVAVGRHLNRTPASGPATVRSSIAAGVLVHALCLDCDHVHPIDLAELAGRGLAGAPLPELRLRCGCGSGHCRVIVSGPRCLIVSDDPQLSRRRLGRDDHSP